MTRKQIDSAIKHSKELRNILKNRGISLPEINWETNEISFEGKVMGKLLPRGKRLFDSKRLNLP